MPLAIEHVNAAVVGLGIGRHHAQVYAGHPHATLAALCDTDTDRLAERGEDLGVAEDRRFTDHEALFEAAADLDLHAVSVATPNTFHAPVTLAALEAGLHVLCEKPLAMTAADAERMVAEAEARGLALGVNLSFRFRPQSRALKALVDDGRLGDVYYARTRWFREWGMPKFGGWFGTKALSGGGPIIDLGVHRLDLALWLMGNPEPTSVSASVYDALGAARALEEKQTFDVEDLGVALVRFDSGATLLLEASWAGYMGKREDQVTEILGTRGGLVQRNLNEGYDYEAFLYTREAGSLLETRVRRRLEPTPDAYTDFIDALREGREPLAPGRHGLQVQRILDAVYRSAETGGEVPVERS